MGILTVAGIGIVTVLIAGQLKVLKSEYSLYLSVAVMLLIFFYSAGRLGGILSVMEQIQTYFPVNEIYCTYPFENCGSELYRGVCFACLPGCRIWSRGKPD